MKTYFLNIIGCCLVIFFSILGCEKSVQTISDIPTNTFQNIFVETSSNAASSIAETHDGFIISASIFQQSSISPYISLIKTNDSGKKIWIKKIDQENGGFNNAATKIIVVEDGFVIVGRTYVAEGVALWVFKTDLNGNLLWSKSIRQYEGGEARDIIQTTDGFIVVGEIVMSWSIVPRGITHQNGWVLKLDKNGNIISSKTFGDSSYSRLSYIEKTGYGFLTAGSTTNLDGKPYLWIVAIDNEGNFLWEKTYSNFGMTYSSPFMKDRDGSFVISFSVADDSLRKINLIKITEYGEIIWNKNTEHTSRIVSLSRTVNNDYAIIGYPVLNPNYYFSLLRFDMNANFKWKKHYASNADSVIIYPQKIISTKDNGFAIIGNIYEQDTTKIFFYKTDSFGEFK